MDEEPKSYEYNEFVSSKLCEWADPIARLEKKRIQKQIINQHCREWMQDIVSLDPQEVALLARDENEALQWKRDHARYVRKAVFDEYTFKKKPRTEKKEDQSNEWCSRKTMKIVNESKLELKIDEGPDGHDKLRASCGGEGVEKELQRLGIDFDDSDLRTAESSPIVGDDEDSWFCRRWMTSTGLAQECVPPTANRERNIFLLVRSLVKDALGSLLEVKVLETVRLLRRGMLFDAIRPKVVEMVETLVENAKGQIPQSERKWLEMLLKETPKKLTSELVNDVFDVAPSNYFQQKISRKFMTALLIPLSESIIKKYVKNDPTIVTTSFNRKNMVSYVKRELNEYHHFSTTFKIADEVARIVADEVAQVASFRLDLPTEQSEQSESELGLKEKCEKRMAALENQAVAQAKKYLHHLKDPETARKDIDKTHSAGEGYTGKKDFCRCAKISRHGGEKKPFKVPQYKIKSNYYFYNKFISDANKNLNPVTLYPKSTNHIKLVCDDHWKCTTVPLERELRDIPYRFSYAPPSVINQIRETKSIKKSDRPMIVSILKNMNENKKPDDNDTILKKIMNEKPLKVESLTSSFSVESPEQVQNADSAMDQSTARVMRSISSTESGMKILESAEKSSIAKAETSVSYSKASWLTGKSSSVDPKTISAVIPKKRMSRQVSKEVSRASKVPEAPKPPAYHKYVMQGYNYSMVPVTPCRFHSLKKIKDILKRFETAGEAAALEYHFETPLPPVNIDELLPIPRLVDAYGQWKHAYESDTSMWTKGLNDSRLKRMAQFRKLHHKDPVFGFTSNWEGSAFKCQP